MAATVNQPSKQPTRKLTAAVVINFAMGWAGLALQNFAPEWYDPAVWTSSETALIAMTGYWLVKDAPNA